MVAARLWRAGSLRGQERADRPRRQSARHGRQAYRPADREARHFRHSSARRARQVLLRGQRREDFRARYELGASRRAPQPRCGAIRERDQARDGRQLQHDPLLGRQCLRGHPLLRPVRRERHHGMAGLRDGMRFLSAARRFSGPVPRRGHLGRTEAAQPRVARAVGRQQRRRRQSVLEPSPAVPPRSQPRSGFASRDSRGAL